MTELRIGDQTIRHDREATARIYANLRAGGCEECGCVFCKNFAAQRDTIYPSSFRILLGQLGIDPAKEGEAFECAPVRDGRHLYGGWFYFVGELIDPGERLCSPLGTDCFDYFVTTNHPPVPAFRGRLVLAIEFSTSIGWVIPESPQAGR